MARAENFPNIGLSARLAVCYNEISNIPRQALGLSACKEREAVPRPRNFPSHFEKRPSPIADALPTRPTPIPSTGKGRRQFLCAARRGAQVVCLALLAPCRPSFAQSRPLRVFAVTAPSAFHFTPGSPLVRVGLMAWSNPRQFALRSVGGARLTGTNSEEIAAGLGPWKATRSGGAYLISDAQNRTLGVLRNGSRWRLQCEDADGLACLVNGRGGVAHYRGALEIRLRSGRLQIINEVALETYLRGVVSREMGRAPLEALKAQAVAARTYAVSHLGQWSADGYDVRDTTDSQVYAGADGETAQADAAIAATTGAILMQNQNPIAALFCADCGGACVPETDGFSVRDSDAHGVDKPNPPGWSFTLSAARLLALLQPALKLALAASKPFRIQNPKSKIPAPDANDALDPIAACDPEVIVPAPPPAPSAPPPIVPTLDRVDIALTDASGRVRKMRYAYSVWTGAKSKTKNARQAEISGNALRSLLGVNTLRSTLFTVKKDAAGDFVFTGRGWGHGHGLCQTGAMALASEPFHYDFHAILARYYPAAAIGQLTYLEPEDSVNEAQTALPVTSAMQSEANRGGR